MQNFLRYWFWPNPGNWHYHDTPVASIILLCVAMIVLSFAVKYWRSRQKNLMTKTLSAGWSSAIFWFGVIGLVLVISRVETIQFFSMRSLWALWVLCIALYVSFQVLSFRRRHYTVMERTNVTDEREKYLPKRKR